MVSNSEKSWSFYISSKAIVHFPNWFNQASTPPSPGLILTSVSEGKWRFQVSPLLTFLLPSPAHISDLVLSLYNVQGSGQNGPAHPVLFLTQFSGLSSGCSRLLIQWLDATTPPFPWWFQDLPTPPNPCTLFSWVVSDCPQFLSGHLCVPQGLTDSQSGVLPLIDTPLSA